MKGYKELSSKIVFNFNEALEIYKNRSTTYTALRRLVKKGLLVKIRTNLYSCINPATNTIYANKYQIASTINDSCYISHSSALAYHGYQNQVSNYLYVSSKKRFNEFEFEGITYKYVKPHSLEGVITPLYSYKIKVTDIEKTIIDSIHSIDTIITLEELLNNLALVSSVSETKFLKYLKLYNIQALYQKSAYILSLHKDNLNLCNAFFNQLKSNIVKGVSYLNIDARNDGTFIKDYNLIIPSYLNGKAGKKNHDL